MVAPDYFAYMYTWIGSQAIDGGNDFEPVEGSWVSSSMQGTFNFSDWGFVFGIRKAWKGTIYVDNIVFTP